MGVAILVKILTLFFQELFLTLLTRLVTQAAEKCPTFWGWGVSAKARVSSMKLRKVRA
jgi:hypothetical protein